jgi:O-acetylserine/cysteine efflux transporter
MHLAHSPTSRTISPVDVLLLLMVTFIWGSNFVVIKFGLQGFDPLLLALLRFAMAAFPLIFLLPRPKLHLGWLVLNGIVMGSGQFGLLFMALQNGITPGLASLLMQLQVFITIVLSAAIFSERLSSRQIIGLLTAGAGLVLVGWHIDADLSLRGLALTLAATSFWAVSNLLTKHVAKQSAIKINMLSFIVWSSLFAVPPLAAMVYVVVGPELALSQLHSATWTAWAAALWQAVGNTLVGFGLWSVLLAKYPASVVTPWALLVPVFGMASSALFFAERFPAWKFLVFILVIGGIALANWPARSAKLAGAAR